MRWPAAPYSTSTPLPRYGKPVAALLLPGPRGASGAAGTPCCRGPGPLSPAWRRASARPTGPGRGKCVGKAKGVLCPHGVRGRHGAGLAGAVQQRCRDLGNPAREPAEPVPAIARGFRLPQCPGDKHGDLGPARHTEFRQHGRDQVLYRPFCQHHLLANLEAMGPGACVRPSRRVSFGPSPCRVQASGYFHER